MSEDALFGLSLRERFAAVKHFVVEEAAWRRRMLYSHPEREMYWRKRVEAVEECEHHLDELEKLLPKEG